jgi:integrase/ribosomal protein L40E
MKVDIHNYDKYLEYFLKKLDKLDSSNKDFIIKFVDRLFAEGLSKGRIAKYVYCLINIAKFLNKPFLEATKEDIEKVVGKIEKNESWSEWTKHEYKVVLRRFYKWLRNSEDYPPEVKWIKITSKKSFEKLQGKILTLEEVEKLANATDNPRDKAFVLVLFESGCRIGEFLPLKRSNITFDNFGIKFVVNGKTGTREVRIIKYQKEFKEWLEVHPLKHQNDFFIWVSLGDKNRLELMSYGNVRKLLLELKKKAGINKPVNPHAFRHASVTYFSKFLPDSLLKKKFGWVRDTDMLAVYEHLDGKDLDEALLKLHGLKQEEIKESKQLDKKVCPRCGHENSILSQFCSKCTMPLDLKAVIELDETRRKLDEFMLEMLKRIAEKYPSIKKDFRELVKEKNLEDLFKLKE